MISNFEIIQLGVATTDNKVKVYDIRMLKLQQLYKAHQGPVSQVRSKYLLKTGILAI